MICMRNTHWTDDSFLAALYGAAGEDEHVVACVDCRRRLQSLRQRRALLRATELEVSEEFLAAQRRSIQERLVRRPRRRALRFVPVMAAILLLIAVMVTVRHGPEPPKPAAVVSDEKVFEEVFTLVSDPEPQAVAPIRYLFEVQQ